MLPDDNSSTLRSSSVLSNSTDDSECLDLSENESHIKKVVQKEISHVQEDISVLRNVDMELAYDYMQLLAGDTDVSCSYNIEKLKKCAEHATRAFRLVEDPLDKIRCIKMIIFSEYYIIGSHSPNQNSSGATRAGKKQAQRIMEHYIGQIDIFEEMQTRRLLTKLFRSQRHCREILSAFLSLSASVFWLHPLNENENHPRFQAIESCMLDFCRR